MRPTSDNSLASFNNYSPTNVMMRSQSEGANEALFKSANNAEVKIEKISNSS
jgi:hypothetical protein